ncbi:DUF2933 domain-containing protein [Leucobacter sp. wl10]|uniref:DUF2933 domain-containing protein n=1 Tax=Leucobacter sp. wl10 TaxID=2304677 RepID=UPI000E5B4071|nr:DUF2933 domain-containing protein [Leucobacter sp. wl10]RGE18887.1 DUF2933 domain-containing protein [Leucobacter sp. wl10]
MAPTIWLTLTAVVLLYVTLGIWAVATIFPVRADDQGEASHAHQPPFAPAHGILGIAALVVLALLAAGRSLGEALPLAALLACPLMMIGMMFMGHGAHGHPHRGADAPPPAEHPSADRSPGGGSEAVRR